MMVGELRELSNVCLSCGRFNDRVSSVGDEDRAPGPGDITICITCGHIMAFAEDMGLRELNNEEIIEIAGDPLIVRLQEARVKAQKNSD